MANFIERYRMKRKVKENMTKKKTPVQGTMKGKPIDTTGGPSYMKKTTKPSASTMDRNAYTPTQLKPVGPNMGKVNKVKGNIGKVQQVTQDTIYGGMQDNKDYKFTQKTVKKPTTKKKPSTKKKSRGLVTMTSMQNKYL